MPGLSAGHHINKQRSAGPTATNPRSPRSRQMHCFRSCTGSSEGRESPVDVKTPQRGRQESSKPATGERAQPRDRRRYKRMASPLPHATPACSLQPPRTHAFPGPSSKLRDELHLNVTSYED